jgi:hypothetical protein
MSSEASPRRYDEAAAAAAAAAEADLDRRLDGLLEDYLARRRQELPPELTASPELIRNAQELPDAWAHVENLARELLGELPRWVDWRVALTNYIGWTPEQFENLTLPQIERSILAELHRRGQQEGQEQIPACLNNAPDQREVYSFLQGNGPAERRDLAERFYGDDSEKSMDALDQLLRRLRNNLDDSGAANRLTRGKGPVGLVRRGPV